MTVPRLTAALVLAAGLIGASAIGPAAAESPTAGVALAGWAEPMQNPPPDPGNGSSGGGGGGSSGGSTGSSSSGGSSGGGSSGGSTGSSGTGGGNSTGSSGSGSGTGSTGDTGSREPSPEPEPDPEPTPEPAVPDAIANAKAEAAAAAERAQERAARAAAQLAAARQRATTTWNSRGRPERLLLIRAATIDVVSGGRLINQIARTGPVSTMASLDRVAPDSWLSSTGDTATLAAVVSLSPGTTLDLGGARTVRLAGGVAAPDAATIYTGGGRLVARNVTVSSVDPATDQPMQPGPGRPYIVVTRGGRLDATDATFSDLGTLPEDPAHHGGVQFNDGSSGSLVRATMTRNTIGLRLNGSTGVKIDGLSVADSRGDGLLLQGDTGTTLRGVRAERNGANGVLVQGPEADRAISEISTTGNKAFGLAVEGQVRPRIVGVTTASDGAGGLRLNHVTQPVVSDFVATDQPIGVFTHVGSTGLVLERLHITGGRRGLVIEKSTTGLEVRDSSIDQMKSVGASLGGHEITLNRVSVTGSRTAVRAERGSSGVTATGMTISGGEDGFVANPGSSRVVVRDLVADGVGNDAVRTYSPDTQIIGGRITGADTGIVAAAAASVTDTSINQVHTGLRSRGGVPVAADRIGVAALTVGIDAAPGSPVQLSESRVHALQALRGEVQMLGLNDLSLPPLNLLGAVGFPLIILAILLESVHAVRQRKFHPAGGRRRIPPLAAAGA
jgi:hypothetical protein